MNHFRMISRIAPCAIVVTLACTAMASGELCQQVFPVSPSQSQFEGSPVTRKIRNTLNYLRRYRKGEGTAEFETFFRREQKKIRIENVRGNDQAFTIDGSPARALFTSGAKGVQNAGIYFHTAKDGSRRVVKLLRLDPVTLKDPDLTKQWPMPPAVQEIANAYLAEYFGGPKLYNFGVAETPQGRFVYLEFEEIFPGQSFKTSKDIMKEQKVGQNLKTGQTGEMHRDLAAMSARFPGGDNLVRAIAQLVMHPILSGVGPGDTDFAISPTGQLRWLDTANWQEFGTDRRALFAEYADIIRKFLPAGHLVGEPALIPSEAHASKVFLTEVLRFLKTTDRFSADEKRLFIKIVFAEKPAFLASGVTQNQVLYESGIIADLAKETRSAADIVQALYDSLEP